MAKNYVQSKVLFDSKQQQYHKFDLSSWGPRTKRQQDSYSWTLADRKQLASLRDAKVLPPMVEYTPQYAKLPPITSNSEESEISGLF